MGPKAPGHAAHALPLEPLESRQLLSASCSDIAPAARAALASSVDGLSPAQIKHAYGFDKITGDGTGQTIAIIDAFSDPNIAKDLATFDTQFGLTAPPSFKQVNQSGGTTLPSTDQGWASEIALDVEWAHAIAPNANILLVDTKTDDISNLMAGVKYARSAPGVSVVSMSWGGGEFSGQKTYDTYFTTPKGHNGVTFVAASGDEGARGGAEWPASSPNVVGVGGTTLSLSGSTSSSESAWRDSSGGTSTLESTPPYQSAVSTTGRSTPDVAFDADPNTGFAVYDTFGDTGWSVAGGTSAGTPQWGALVAIADQTRVQNNLTTLDGSTGTLPAIYKVAANTTTYSANFNDITTGGGFGDGGGHDGFGGWRHRFQTPVSTAKAGYDQITGLGTPKAAQLVASLSTAIQPPLAAVKKAVKLHKKVVRKPAEQQAPDEPSLAAVAAQSQTPTPTRPESRVDVSTAVGLARPESLTAAPAGVVAAVTPTVNLEALSGFLTTESTTRGLASSTLTTIAESAATISTHAIAQSAAAIASAVIPAAVVAPQEALSVLHLDAANSFSDALSAFVDESAALAPMQAEHASPRAWAITGIAIAADALLLGHYYSSRGKRKAKVAAIRVKATRVFSDGAPIAGAA